MPGLIGDPVRVTKEVLAMGRLVMKFGGTSVADIERIRNVARQVKAEADRGNEVAVVVSAMAGDTNRLIALAKEVQAQPDPRELDMMVSTGEQVTIALVSMAMIACAVPAWRAARVDPATTLRAE